MVHRWHSLVVLAVVLSACAEWAPAQEKKEKDPTEKVTLQYRVAKDAFAPSRFVAVIDGGISLGLKVAWDLPTFKDKDKQAAQDKQKKEFDALIKKLEAGSINGVEFECRGEWLRKGFEIRLTTVPQPTAAGKQRIKDGGN